MQKEVERQNIRDKYQLPKKNTDSANTNRQESNSSSESKCSVC